MAMAKVEAAFTIIRKGRSHQSRKHTRLHSKTHPISNDDYIWWRERTMVKYYIKRWSFQDQRKKVSTTGFLALQFKVNWLKAPTLRVSL